MTRLYRSESDRILGGVCGGIAEIYDLDPSLVRIVTVLLILSGVTPLLYLIAWLIIPSESELKGSKEKRDLSLNSEDESSDKKEESE